MCQICDLERGKEELLMYDLVELVIRNRKIKNNYSNVFIKRDDNGYYSLLFDYHITDDLIASSINMPIQFCPFCGKELQHEPPKQYPWNQEKRG